MKKILLAFGAVVLALPLGMLFFAVLGLGGSAEKAKVSRALSDFDAIHFALKMFEGTTGAMPTTEEGLRALVDQPRGWPGGRRWSRLMDNVPHDPWGTEYRYTRNSVGGLTRVKVGSAGKDGVDGTKDDWARVEERCEGTPP